MNYRILCYQAILLAWGDIPHPRATVTQLQWAIKIRLMKMFPNSPDPEVPDGLLQILIPALKVRGVEGEEIAKVGASMMQLGDPATGAAAATLGDTIVSVENESVMENIGDIAGGILSLDIGKTVSGIGDLFGDLFGGGGLFD